MCFLRGRGAVELQRASSYVHRQANVAMGEANAVVLAAHVRVQSSSTTGYAWDTHYAIMLCLHSYRPALACTSSQRSGPIFSYHRLSHSPQGDFKPTFCIRMS